MTCKYSSFSEGDDVTLKLTSMTCVDCGHILYDSWAEAVYRGHTTHKGRRHDKLEFKHPFTCPGCGEERVFYLDPCDEKPNLFQEYISTLVFDKPKPAEPVGPPESTSTGKCPMCEGGPVVRLGNLGNAYRDPVLGCYDCGAIWAEPIDG